MSSSRIHATQLLWDLSEGKQDALEELTPIVYKELYRLARLYMAGERVGHVLQPTALVNEAYLRLIDYKNVKWASRTHFYAVCAQIMRHVLVDEARRRKSPNRSGAFHVTTFDEGVHAKRDRGVDLMKLDDALNALRKIHPRRAEVIDLRYFGGLSVEETAKVLKVSPQTILRDWAVAKVWLLRYMKENRDTPPSPQEPARKPGS